MLLRRNDPRPSRTSRSQTQMITENTMIYSLHLTSCSLKLQGPETGLPADDEETIKTDKKEETVLVRVCHLLLLWFG